jgi:hypothetical protein
MFDDEFQNVRFFLKDNQLFSTRCIWCGSEDKLTESHLFPQSIGGRFAAYTSCGKCNSFLGQKFEQEVKKNAFLTAALVKTGVSDKREAYRHAKKTDVETGINMHITKGGHAKSIPKDLNGGKFIGTPQEIKNYIISRFKKQYPNWPVKPLEEFYDDPSRRSFTYVGIRYTKKTIQGGPGELKIEGLSRDPHPFLIFKIACEFLALNNLQNHAIIRQMMNGLIAINTRDQLNRIEFSSNIINLVQSNTSNTFQEYRCLENIPFKDYHYIMLRLSVKLTLYVEVVFFGLLRNFLILGELKTFDDRVLPLVDEEFIFPMNRSIGIRQRYRNLVEPIHTRWADAAVDGRMCELSRKSN